MAKEISIHTWCDECAANEIQTPAETTPPLVIGNAKARTLDLCEEHVRELLHPLVARLNADGVEAVPAGAQLPPRPIRRRPGTTLARHLGSGTERDPRTGPFDCKVEGCSGRHTVANGGRGYPHLNALKAHLKYAHSHEGINFARYVAVYGEPQPLQPPATDSGEVVEGAAPGWAPLASDTAPDELAQYTCNVPLEDGSACQVAYDPARYRQPAQALGVHRRQAHGVRGPNSKPGPAERQRAAAEPLAG